MLPCPEDLFAVHGLSLKKFLGFNPRLLQDCSQSTLRYIAGVVWNCRVSAGEPVMPDFVTSGSLSVEGETERSKALHNRSVIKAAEARH